MVVSPFLPHRSATAVKMAPIFACRFLICSCTHYIRLHLQSVLQELLPTCSYHFGLGPEYLWVARRRSVFRSALGILFPQYPVYVDSDPRFATWGGARWRITDNPTRGFWGGTFISPFSSTYFLICHAKFTVALTSHYLRN